MGINVDVTKYQFIYKYNLDDFLSELLNLPVGMGNFEERMQALKQKYQIY